MTADTRQAFKTALVTLIQDASSDFALVTTERKMIEEFTTDNYPLVRISEKESSVLHNVTSAEINVVRFEIAIAAKSNLSNDILSGYAETIADAIRDDPQVDDTCDYCLALDQYDPEEWIDDNYKVRYLYYKVMLRRSA